MELNEQLRADQALIEDALTQYAEQWPSYGVLKDAMSYSLLSGGKRIRPVLTLAVCRLFGGQSVDVEYVDRPLSAEQLQFIYELKTGALIEASMMIGAVLAGADADTVEKVGQIGQNVGMAFQIQDDILDVTGDEAVLGKPTKSDEKNHKITYVSVKGLDQARKDVERYSKEAVRLLEELPCENEFLHELILNLISRDA